LLENPELIFDDHARHVAKVFGLVHLLKFKSTDLGGVVILYTSKANVENAKALEHSSTRTFSHTIPRLVMSHCVTIPFTLDLGAVLQELKGALDRACYVILWDTSGGQYRIIAHHVGKERRNQLKELRGDDKTYCTESYGIAIDPSGHGPIASAARTGRHVFLPTPPRLMRRRATCGVRRFYLILASTTCISCLLLWACSSLASPSLPGMSPWRRSAASRA